MSKEQLDEVTRVVVTRCMAAVGGALTEFTHRFPNDEPLIDAIAARVHEDLTMLIPTPDVRQSGK